MRGHDNQADGLPREEHRNGQSPGTTSTRQTASSQRPESRTRTVVRRIDTWSVLKVSVVFYVAVYCILLVAAVLLWLAANTTGLRENVEKVIADLIASGKFHFVGGELFRAGAIGGAMLVVLGTAANVMLSVLYNLISDLVGGMSITVEERPTRRAGRARAREAAMEPRAAAEYRAVKEPALPEPVKILIPEVERHQAQLSEPQPPRLPQPEPRPSQPQPPQLSQPQLSQPESQPQRQLPPERPRLPLPTPAPSSEMSDQQRSDAERVADTNLEAFGL